MLVQDLLTFLTRAFFLLLGILSTLEYLHQREAIKRDVALVFGSIAINTGITILGDVVRVDQFVATLGTLALLAQPYLFLRLSHYLQPVPNIFKRAALVLMFLVWFLCLIPLDTDNINPITATIVLIMIVYFVSINGYVMLRFLFGMRNSSGILRQRLKLCAIGTGLLALALLLILPLVLQPSLQGILLIPVQLAAIFSALSFLFGFVPPRWLQRVWQTTEFRKFLATVRRESASAWLRPMDLLQELALAASKITGGKASLILERTAQKSWRALYFSPSLILSKNIDELQLSFEEVAEKKTSQYWVRDFKLNTVQDRFMDRTQSTAIFLVPIQSSDYLLLIFLAQQPLFPDDDRELLGLLVEQSSIILENIAIVGELQDYSMGLEHKVKERTAEQKRTELRFARVLGTTAEAVITIDTKQSILLFNQSAELMFGYTQDEILGKNLECLLPDEIIKQHSQYVRHFADGHDIARGMGQRYKELSGKRKDGSIFPIEASISKLTEDEEVILTVFIRDISEQVWTTKALRESEGRYERIVENMLEGFQIISFNWQYLYVNEAAAKHGRKAKEELLGYTLLEKYPGIEASDMFALLRLCMEQRSRQHAEFEFFYEDGSSAWFELSIQPVPEGIFILSLDISERKKAEAILHQLNEELEKRVQERTEQLQQSEEKFAKAFLASPAAISISTMPEGRWIEINDALAKMTGYEKEELLGHTSIELGLIDSVARAKILEAIRIYGRVRNIEIQLRTKSGEMLDVLLSVEQIQLNGQICSLTIQYDITELIQAEREIRRLNQDLQERQLSLEAVNKELEAFSYSVSHDLRAPLRAMDGFSQALLEDYSKLLDEDGKDYLNLIRQESQRMGQLIDDLIGLARITRQDLQREQVDLTAMAEEIAAILAKREPERVVQFSIERNLSACADPRLLHVVLENLLGNAWKYSSKQADAHIEVSCQQKDGETQFFVRDNGVGFDMSYVHKLFGVFQRLHGMTEFEGTGIGLATVKRIIHRHGGSIEGEGVVNEGASFYFTLGEINC